MKSFTQFITEALAILLESKIDFLKNKYGGASTDKINTSHDQFAEHRTGNDVVDYFATHGDPTSNKTYLPHIMQLYHAGQFRQEDHPRIHVAYSNFDKYKSKLPNKDINKYKSLSEIEDAVEPHIGTTSSNKEEKRQIKESGAELIHSENGITVHKLKTKEAACQYGAGTKWCTAAKENNMFNSYNSRGPLYVIKARDENNEIKKYQYHPASQQFMNEEDRPINVKSFVKRNPEMHNVFEFRGTHNAIPLRDDDKKIHDKLFTDKIQNDTASLEDIQHAEKHKYLTNDHKIGLQSMLDRKLQDIENIDFGEDIQHAIEHNYLSSHSIHRIIDHPDYFMNHHSLNQLSKSKNFNLSHVEKILNSHDIDDDLKSIVGSHQLLTPQHIDKLLSHTSIDIQRAAARNPNVSSENITKALMSPHREVINAIATHAHKFTDDQFDSYFKDPTHGMYQRYTGQWADLGRKDVALEFQKKHLAKFRAENNQ